MQTELTKFRVRNGKTQKVDEWLLLINEYKDSVCLAVEYDVMQVRWISREIVNDGEYLYWYYEEPAEAMKVHQSDQWVIQTHLDYWDECIDTNYIAVDYATDFKFLLRK